MKTLVILFLLFTQSFFAQGCQNNTTGPERSPEAEEFSPDMTEEEEEREEREEEEREEEQREQEEEEREQREEEEAREQAERERWILEERARGYEPTSEEYIPVHPKRKRVPAP